LRLPAGGHALDAVGHGVQLGQQAIAFTQQFLAGFGQLGLARGAVKQQHIQRRLQLPHAVSQSAGHQPEFARRCGHAAGAVDHGDHVQCAGGEGVAKITHWGFFSSKDLNDASLRLGCC
jgi:hypothetical protein